MAFAYPTCMSQGVRLVRFEGEERQTVARIPSSQVELEHVRNVTNSLTQDALNVWAELWAELQNGIACGVAVEMEGRKGFEPSCGWPEFLDKMWILRQNLDFLARFSRQ
jgi:hypothetical protein